MSAITAATTTTFGRADCCHRMLVTITDLGESCGKGLFQPDDMSSGLLGTQRK